MLDHQQLERIHSRSDARVSRSNPLPVIARSMYLLPQMEFSIVGEADDGIRLSNLRHPMITRSKKERAAANLDFPQFRQSSQNQGEISKARMMSINHGRFPSEMYGGDAVLAKLGDRLQSCSKITNAVERFSQIPPPHVNARNASSWPSIKKVFETLRKDLSAPPTSSSMIQLLVLRWVLWPIT